MLEHNIKPPDFGRSGSDCVDIGDMGEHRAT